MGSGRTIVRVACALGGAIALGVGQMVASADTLTAITVDCGDGYPISATVDTATLTKVEGAIQGMIDNPAGLSCSLSTTPTLTPTTTTGTTAPPSPGNGDGFVTGGGRYDAGCIRNFGLSGHFDKNGAPGAAHGTSNVTQSSANGCTQGHITSSVYCMDIGIDASGNGIAQLQSTITQVDGIFAAPDTSGGFGLKVGDKIETDMQDSVSGPDKIFHRAGASGVCAATGEGFPVVNGNVKVRQS
jgi:hypothetical protein